MATHEDDGLGSGRRVGHAACYGPAMVESGDEDRSGNRLDEYFARQHENSGPFQCLYSGNKTVFGCRLNGVVCCRRYGCVYCCDCFVVYTTPVFDQNGAALGHNDTKVHLSGVGVT